MLVSLNLEQTNWLTKKYAYFLKTICQSIKTLLTINNCLTLKTTRKNLKIVVLFFNKHTLCCYNQLLDIAAEDHPEKKNRFVVNYIISSLLYNQKLLLSVSSNSANYLPSITEIFKAAGWLEREVWDLFGIYFKNNNNLAKILSDYGFSGHPLRKDFPLTGFYEIVYSLEKKRTIILPVELSQEFRVFSF